jgi:hypothetical protein
MAVVLTNNATTQLATSLTTGTTTLSVTAGTGAKFPAPGASQWFPVTLIKANGTLEICRCTSRSGDVLTVARAQEGTAAQAFAAGDRVELRLTNAAMAEFGQLGSSQQWMGSNTFQGPTVYNSNSTHNADLYFATSGTDTPGLIFSTPTRAGYMDMIDGNVRIFQYDGTTTLFPLQCDWVNQRLITYNGGIVWHSGNFAPAAYLPVGGKAADSDLLDGRDSGGFLLKAASNVNCETTRITSAVVPNIAAAQQNQTALAIDNGNNQFSSASIELHRLGSFIAFFGIDTDNQLKVGGGSFGANAYPIWTDYNGNLKATNAQAALPVGSVGSYAFCRNLNGGTLGAGAVLSGSELRYTDTSNAGGIAPPSGSWRSMGECRSGYSSLWLRYA